MRYEISPHRDVQFQESRMMDERVWITRISMHSTEDKKTPASNRVPNPTGTKASTDSISVSIYAEAHP